jgi:hypothetical protein
VVLEDLGEPIGAIRPRGGDPAQVVEPHVLQRQPVGLHADPRGQASLERDGNVAEADGAMPRIHQGLGHDPDRIGEVHDPGLRKGAPPGELGQLQDDGHRAQRFCQPAGPGRLLADGAEAEGERLVEQPCRLTADPKLDEHERRTVHGFAGIAGQRQPAVPLEPPQHARGESTHDVAACGVDVVQHELVDRQSVVPRGQPIHQLGRVRAAAADDGDLDTHL